VELRAVRRGHPRLYPSAQSGQHTGLSDARRTDRIRTIFALDRLSDAPYTDWEIETVRSIRELLKLFHRLLFTCADDEAAQLTSRTELQTLTPREMEIVNLLEQGITPANIAHILHITVPTTNRHIYNIYKKVNVNSRAELMAKIK